VDEEEEEEEEDIIGEVDYDERSGDNAAEELTEKQGNLISDNDTDEATINAVTEGEHNVCCACSPSLNFTYSLSVCHTVHVCITYYIFNCSCTSINIVHSVVIEQLKMAMLCFV